MLLLDGCLRPIELESKPFVTTGALAPPILLQLVKAHQVHAVATMMYQTPALGQLPTDLSSHVPCRQTFNSTPCR